MLVVAALGWVEKFSFYFTLVSFHFYLDLISADFTFSFISSKIKYINKFVNKKKQIYKSEEKIIMNKTIFLSKGGFFRRKNNNE